MKFIKHRGLLTNFQSYESPPHPPLTITLTHLFFNFYCPKDGGKYNTTTSQGHLMFNLFASFAEFERDLISERTKAGLEHARANGRKGGCKPGLSKANQAKALAAIKLLEDTSKN